MVAHGFVKHGFKVLLHCVVDGPLQASCCLVLQSFNELCSFTPGCVMYFGPKRCQMFWNPGWLLTLRNLSVNMRP